MFSFLFRCVWNVIDPFNNARIFVPGPSGFFRDWYRRTCISKPQSSKVMGAEGSRDFFFVCYAYAVLHVVL